jgi:GNAT superfamily N-acetyltransferase
MVPPQSPRCEASRPVSGIQIKPISEENYRELSVLVGELLQEIMDTIKQKAFNYDETDTERRVRDLIENEKYWVFIALDKDPQTLVGFVSLYESYALYAEGAYGTIPELYVRPAWRSRGIGNRLLEKAMQFGKERAWRRLEVTTPPLPQFERTLRFYQANGFEVAGGRKLKAAIDV